MIGNTRFRLTKLPVALEYYLVFWMADTKWCVETVKGWKDMQKGITINREVEVNKRKLMMFNFDP